MTPIDRHQVWTKTQGRCWYCGKQATPWGDFSVDHVIVSWREAQAQARWMAGG